MKINEKIKSCIRPNKNKYHRYLLKQSVDSVGAIMCDDGVITTREGSRYYVYRIEYQTPNGIDRSIDNENHESMVQLLNSLEHEFKILFPREQKNNLDNNIAYYENIIKETSDKNIREVLEERVRIMNIFNAEKYVSMIMYIRVESNDIFRKTSRRFLNIQQIKGKKLIELQSTLNNEME